MAVPLRLKSERLQYERGSIDTTLNHHNFLIDTQSTWVTWESSDSKVSHGLWYTRLEQTPDLLNLVNMRDNTDPLNIHEGNSALKKSKAHTIRYVFNASKALYHGFSLQANMVNNAIAMGYRYDTSTGIRTYRAYNVNGNWRAEGAYSLGAYIDRRKRLRFSGRTSLMHEQNVDMAYVTDHPARSIVRSQRFSGRVSLHYQHKGQSLQLRGQLQYRNMYSLAGGLYDFNYGLAGHFTLPAAVSIASDVTMYSHRGYGAREMNSNDIVWNIRASKHILNGRLTFTLDGFDVLGQLSNISYTVNGQARTEIRRQALPRYVMFHVQWKFSKQPRTKI